MNEPGDKLSAAYRALPREEPGAALDNAILAASRRAVAARPFAARRWAAPVSIAAVLVLAFGVTLNMQREEPGIETPTPDMHAAPPVAAQAPIAPAPAPETPAAKRIQEIAPPAQGAKRAKVARAEEPARLPPSRLQERDRAFRDEAASPERKDLTAQGAPAAEALQKESKVVASTAMAPPPAPAAAPAPAARAAPATSMVAPAAKPDGNEARGSIAQMKRESFTAPTRAAADAQAPADEITRELEAIAKLRVEGRHAEADKALEEFRRKHPGHRIADAMWERVKPR